MKQVYVALGSNVGDSSANLAYAIELLGQKLTHIKRAPIYTSKAVGYTEQPDFLNTAITGETNLSPKELLKFIKDIEKKVGRVERFRWGPREVDIDIIFYDQEIIDEPGLHVPHQRFSERDFVLKPLCDIDPDFVDPKTQQTVVQLYAKIPASERAIKDS